MKSFDSSDDESNDCVVAHLDLSLVHQKAFPSFWNQVKFDTFPCNYFVIGFVSGSIEKLYVQGDGGGGLLNVIPLLRSDQVQYCGFRISRSRLNSETDSENIVSLKPYFILLRWIGQHTSPLQVKDLDKDLEFIKGYFQNATITITINENEFHHSEQSSRKDSIMEKVLSIVKNFNVNNINDSEAISKIGDGKCEEELDVQYDFMNKNCVTVCTHYDYDEEGDEASMSHDALHNAMQQYEDAQRQEEEREKVQALNAMDPRYDPNLKNLYEEYAEDDGELLEKGHVEVKEDENYGQKYTDESGVDPKAPHATLRPPRVPISNNNNLNSESKFDNYNNNNNNNSKGIMSEGFLRKLGKNGFLNDTANKNNYNNNINMTTPAFKDELKRAATSYTDVDKLLDTAKQQDEELKRLEMERIKLSQQRMELYQEQAAQQLELKRQAQHDKLSKRLEERKRRRLNKQKAERDTQTEEAKLIKQHFSNNAQNRIKAKQRTAQRIIERKLHALEKKTIDSRCQLSNAENIVKLNEERLVKLALKQVDDLSQKK